MPLFATGKEPAGPLSRHKLPHAGLVIYVKIDVARSMAGLELDPHGLALPILEVNAARAVGAQSACVDFPPPPLVLGHRAQLPVPFRNFPAGVVGPDKAIPRGA